MAEERFSRLLVETLAKRAGNVCTNPDCQATTSGPSGNARSAIVVGEAAHIYGARPGSARFDSAMTDSARSDITNGIWLCRNCHKAVDSDPQSYPADLLFEWRLLHERSTADALGKGGLIRYRMVERRLQNFPDATPLVQRLLLDRPDYWEFKLTAELLRSGLLPLKLQWEALGKGLYGAPKRFVTLNDCSRWFQSKLESLLTQVHALTALVNGEIQQAWGAPGEAGSDSEIKRMCDFVIQACRRILEWEEDVRFTELEEPYDELHALLSGIGGDSISRTFALPLWLDEVLRSQPTETPFSFELVFDLPDNWVTDIEAATARIAAKLS